MTPNYALHLMALSKKYVENYQRVQPGQGVVCLINPAKLQVEFTIPETNISYVTSPSTIYVEFDAYKGNYFRQSKGVCRGFSRWGRSSCIPLH